MSALPDLTVVHQDDALVVVDKPSGLLSVPGRGPQGQDCIAHRVQARWPDALIVHRLDMATSGLMVLARGAAWHRQLSMAFAERHVAKRYVALAHGHLADDAGTMDWPLICDWPNRPRQMVDLVDGKPSLTRYRVLQRRPDGNTRVALEPVTGRSHQLRVHMQALGHPLLGDELYAPPDVQALAPRLMLHAEHLALVHPRSGEPVQFDSPPPF